MLFDQPSKMPTRKLAAMVLVTFVVQGDVGVADQFFPGARGVLPAQGWIEMGVPILAAYFVRDRANTQP